jgi:hypothetical protein
MEILITKGWPQSPHRKQKKKDVAPKIEILQLNQAYLWSYSFKIKYLAIHLQPIHVQR